MGHVTRLSRAKLHGISRMFQVKLNTNSCWENVCWIQFEPAPKDWPLCTSHSTIPLEEEGGGGLPFLVGKSLSPKLLSWKKSYLYTSPKFSNTAATSIQDYLFYKVAWVICNPTRCYSLGHNLFHFQYDIYSRRACVYHIIPSRQLCPVQERLWRKPGIFEYCAKLRNITQWGYTVQFSM